MTPYVVVDTKALVQHLSIVKHFVSMKKFIVLIPSEGELIDNQGNQTYVMSFI